VAVTNDANSDLAAAAELVVELRADPEVAVAATKTYVAEVAVLAVLSSMLSADPASRDELRIIPSALRIALAGEAEIARLAEHWAGEDRCVVIARGFQYATAREWALKLKELANVLADPYSAADFQHGPIALVREGFPVLAVATSGAALNGMAELLGRLRAAKARLLVLTDDDSLAEASDDLRVPPVPEWLAPLVAIVPAQLFAYHLSRSRGLDTETPPNITKVTRTL
jgi:glucosamine--fructose-6-phosphate aminotransferase (isomerizing)